MRYQQLTQGQRYQNSALLKADRDQSEIARLLERNNPAISRELERNTGHRLIGSLLHADLAEVAHQRSLVVV